MCRHPAFKLPLPRPLSLLIPGLALALLLTVTGCRQKATVAPPPTPTPERVEKPTPIQPPVLEARLEPEVFDPEQGTWLIWESTGAPAVTISPDIGEVLPSGKIQLFPGQDSIYQLSASGPGGETRREVRAVLRTRSTVDSGQASDLSQKEEFRIYFRPVYFEFRSTRLDEVARNGLDRAIAWLKSPANGALRLLVEGHCDQRGSDEYGLALGDMRAAVVRAYLLASGIEESRVETVSLGTEIDLAGSDTPEEHALNRRAEFFPIEEKD